MLLVVFIITPVIVLMAILAEPLVVFLFTDKWLEMVPIFQVICLSGVLYPIHLYNLIILQVKGRSDLFLKLEIVKKIIIVIVLPISIYFGFYALLWGQLISSILALFINTHYAGKILNYSTWMQLKDLAPIFIFAAFLAVVVYFSDQLLSGQSHLLRLIAGSILGGGLYLLLAWLFKFDSLKDIKNLILKK